MKPWAQAATWAAIGCVVAAAGLMLAEAWPFLCDVARDVIRLTPAG